MQGLLRFTSTSTPKQASEVFGGIAVDGEAKLTDMSRSRGAAGVGTMRRPAEGADLQQGGRRIVSDDGPGIPADVLPRLFKSFVTTKPSGKGTGLGLRICRRLVEEMGGTIAAANRPGHGAIFLIVLPAAPAEQQ